MRGLIMASVFLLTYFHTYSQMQLEYTNYWRAMGTYNPAAICYQQNASVTAIARKQWIGFTGSPFSTELISDYHAEKISTSFGFIGGYHTSGSLVSFDFRAQSAYRINFKNDHYLQLGGEIGMASYTISNANWITPGSQPDPSLPSANSTDYGLTLGGGLFYCAPKFFFSLSSLQINQAYLNEVHITLTRTYHLMSGYKIAFGEAGELMPTVNFYSDGVSTGSAYNLVATYDQRLYFGVGIRPKNALTFCGGYATKSFRLGYSFDLTTSTIAQYSRGTHEFYFSWYLPTDK